MNWKDAVYKALMRCCKHYDTPLIDRKMLLHDELEQIVDDTGSTGRTPEQTVSRVLQQLRDDGKISFCGKGQYLVYEYRNRQDAEIIRSQSRDWDSEEIRLIVADYFDMLVKEMQGKAYSKTEHRRRLKPRLCSRSDSSIEMKYMTISAVLKAADLPFIEGYKPYQNLQLYQNLQPALRVEVFSQLEIYREQIEAAFAASINEKAFARVEVVEPPARSETVEETEVLFRGSIVDFQRREREARWLGDAGERFVLEFEISRLRTSGRQDLASQVELVSKTRGDGLGYDILSFSEEGAERYIEVKTTTRGSGQAFSVTRREVIFSQRHPENYFLYRVFDFPKAPKIFIVNGDLSKNFYLVPTDFKAMR